MMPRSSMIGILFVLVLVGSSGWAVAIAQDATPTTEAEGPVVVQQPPAAGQATPSALGELNDRPVAHPGGDLPGDPSLQVVKVAEGFYDPVNVASPSDGSGRLFVVERPGLIRIVNQDGTVVPEPFLDLSKIVITAGLEQGLLDMAFHPDYANNGQFFVYYTDWRTTGDSFVTRFQVAADDPNKADPDSAQVILSVDQPYVNHNGGKIGFGPDGYLYIALGDGGNAGDPLETAQNINDLLGSLLRVDVNAPSGGRAYGIPEGNPYEGTVSYSPEARQRGNNDLYHPQARPEIWAFGLRNPWQFSFDPATGDLYLTDVGQLLWEEVNHIPQQFFGEAAALGGLNFGWDFLEGANCYPAGTPECGQVGILPVAEYTHEYGCSITGIGVHRGQASPSLDGIYFNADYCTGDFFGLARDETGTWQYQILLDTELLVTGSGQSETGELYVTSCQCVDNPNHNPLQEEPTGAVWRLVAADQVPQGAETAPTAPPAATEEATPEEVIPESEDGGTPAAEGRRSGRSG